MLGLIAQHGNTVTEFDCLVEIVRDEDNGLTQLRLQTHQFVLEQAAGDRIDGTERFVHQQHRRIGSQRPRHAHTLLLPAGQLARVAVAIGIGIEAYEVEHLVGARCDTFLVPTDQTRDSRDVLRNREVREQACLLDRVPDATAELVRVDRQRVLAVDGDLAGGRFDQAVDHAHRRRLAATRRSDEDHDFTGRNSQRNIVHRCSFLARVPLGDGLQDDLDPGYLLICGYVRRNGFSHCSPFEVVRRPMTT